MPSKSKRAPNPHAQPSARDPSNREENVGVDPPIPEGHAATTNNTRDAGSDSPVAATSPQPSLPSEPTATSRKAYDIKYFFMSPGEDKTSRVCKTCEAISKREPGMLLPNYTFAVSTGYTALRGHMERHHRDDYLRVCQENGWKVQLPEFMKKEKMAEQEARMKAQESRPSFSPDIFLQHLVDFIVADDQASITSLLALNIVECLEFRKLLLVLREGLQDEDIPRRTKVRSSIMTALEDHFRKLKSDLQGSVGKISYTMDIWSDANLRPFLAMTAHWIARDGNALHLKSSLIAFCCLFGKHTGKNLAGVVMELLDRAGATSRTGHFTLDNAANNQTMMKELEALFQQREMSFSTRDNRIMCFPHVVNIVTQDILASITNYSLIGCDEDVEDEDGSSDDGGDSSNNVGGEGEGSDNSGTTDSGEAHAQHHFPPSRRTQTYQEAVKRDPIALCREVVRQIRASGLRRDEFDSMITCGNTMNWFKIDGQVCKVPQLQLLRDVKTRWDSVFTMIKRFIELQPAIDRFLSKDIYELDHLRISGQEWEVLGDFAILLSFPYDFQKVLSTERTPVLAGVIPCFELLMSQWEALAKKVPNVKPFVTAGLKKAYKYYQRMDDTRAYAIAMFVNPNVRLSWISNNWGRDYYNQTITNLKDLMRHYQGRGSMPSGAGTTAPSKATAGEIGQWKKLIGRYEFQLGIEQTFTISDQSVEEEFLAYTSSRVVQTDILQFWQANERTFPTVFKIAMDYLPVQASAVPCERVFSSSAETDTKKRNRLGSDLMEALQILKYSLKQERLNFTKHLMTPMEDLVEAEGESYEEKNLRLKP